MQSDYFPLCCAVYIVKDYAFRTPTSQLTKDLEKFLRRDLSQNEGRARELGYSILLSALTHVQLKHIQHVLEDMGWVMMVPNEMKSRTSGKKISFMVKYLY